VVAGLRGQVLRWAAQGRPGRFVGEVGDDGTRWSGSSRATAPPTPSWRAAIDSMETNDLAEVDGDRPRGRLKGQPLRVDGVDRPAADRAIAEADLDA
jgi:hypothetical protein